MDRASFAALSVQRFASRRDILREYYDFDLPASPKARLTWVEPNLKPLD
jgi:hypothetical protein